MRKVGLAFVGLFLLIALAVMGCTQPAVPKEKVPPPGLETPKPEVTTPKGEEAAFSITSPAFRAGAQVPVKYTCQGQNISPPLDWSQGPAGTASFALIMDDPDAPIGVFTHWVIFNLPKDTRSLPEAIPKESKLPSGALQGKNGFGNIGYAGPCPPSGTHRYQFTLYALDESLDLTAGVSKEQVLAAMKGHILAQVQLVGTYQH